jgi:hypothetical protein
LNLVAHALYWQVIMLLKKIIPVILILYTTNCFAQETVEKRNSLTNKVTEKFFVLKDNETIKHGIYEALYRKRAVIANGNYTMGKKMGRWLFYNPNGVILQVYDYDNNRLKYEAREDTTSDMRYLLDETLSDTDHVSKPIKIGGRYFGYLPYLGLYKTPLDVDGYNAVYFEGIVELLISPLGRLADYKVRVFSNYLQYDQTTHMDINLFNEEDKQFIPATLNGRPVLSRILIRCRMVDGGALDFF